MTIRIDIKIKGCDRLRKANHEQQAGEGSTRSFKNRTHSFQYTTGISIARCKSIVCPLSKSIAQHIRFNTQKTSQAARFFKDRLFAISPGTRPAACRPFFRSAVKPAGDGLRHPDPAANRRTSTSINRRSSSILKILKAAQQNECALASTPRTDVDTPSLATSQRLEYLLFVA